MIALTQSLPHEAACVTAHVWPIRIVSTSSNPAVSPKIFVFLASTEDDAYEGDVFESVASLQQLRYIPEDNAGVDANGEICPYYRTNTLTFCARSETEAEDLWNKIASNVDDLVRNLNVVTNTTETHTSTGD